MSLAYVHERLDEMCARVQREANSHADRIILSMDEYAEISLSEQGAFYRRHGEWGPAQHPYSRWEMSRIVFPRMMADLDALGTSRNHADPCGG
ncbi:hypothetical protein [uncultured Microbacterium sp.]|uniref:hypothetical protein n=1 Tax=uncultured Microbacterium sp. TaxID=191216 RepID=UPI00260422B3|nr:hypothetical protein [uncultured Microbacterium sp.]